jgi:hypothetical protein
MIIKSALSKKYLCTPENETYRRFSYAGKEQCGK